MTDAFPKPERPLPPLPLCRNPPRDALSACNVCGRPARSLRAFAVSFSLRRWGARNPPPLPHSQVYVGRDHETCLGEVAVHPRSYFEVSGTPGNFPLLCGPCPYRGDGYAGKAGALVCLNPRRGSGQLRARRNGLDVVACTGRAL